jgi:hypothetical protein
MIRVIKVFFFPLTRDCHISFARLGLRQLNKLIIVLVGAGVNFLFTPHVKGVNSIISFLG